MIKKYKSTIDEYGFNHREINISVNLISIYYSKAKAPFRGTFFEYKKPPSPQSDFIGMVHTVKGKGRVITTEDEFSVTENTVLFVHHHDCVSFLADGEWEYFTIWFRTSGLKIRLNNLYTIPVFEDEYDTVKDIIRLLDTNDYISCCKANTLAQGVILDVLSNIEIENDQTPYSESMSKIAAYINQHVNENIHVAELADLCAFSKNHFFKVFKQFFNISPQQYIRREKLKKAAFLLLNTSIPIAHIADELSFDSPAHFSSCFKRSYGMTPHQFRHSK